MRKEDDDGFRGRIFFAAAKSGERPGSLGWESEGLEVVGKPRNWDVRSSNCFRRSSELGNVSGPASCSRLDQTYESSFPPDLSNASTPSRIWSNDLEMCPSWELGSRLREMARCRSSNESLI